MSNLTSLFQRVILKENLVLMFSLSVSFWHFRDLKTDCWKSPHLLCEKNTTIILMCGG